MAQGRDKVGIGFVGTGKISRLFADAVAGTEGLAPVSVYSRTERAGEEFAAACGVPAYTADWAGFLSDPTLDAVYIATPNICHYRQALDALRAGKHVLCEKPLTTDLARFDALASEAMARGLVLMEGMRILHDPVFPLIRKTLPQLGKIRRVDFEYQQYSSRYDAYRAGTVLNAFDPTLSNAAVMDIGVYPVALAVSLFGMPHDVSARSVFLSNGFEASGDAVLAYVDMTASLSWSKVADSVFPSVISGEDGSLTVDRLSGTTEVVFRPRKGDPVRLPYTPAPNNMIHEAADFCEAVRGKLDTAPYLSFSRDTVRVLDLIRSSAGIVFPSDATPPEEP